MYSDFRQRNRKGLIWRQWYLPLAVVVGCLTASLPAFAADDPEPSPLFGKSLKTSVDRLAGTPAQSDPQPPKNRLVNPPMSARIATDSSSACIYELVCANATEEFLSLELDLHYGDQRAYGACSTGVDCPEFVFSGFLSLCLKWQFVACDSPMVPEIPYDIISCQCDSLATMPGAPTCWGESTCPGSYTCLGEMSCNGNPPTMCGPSETCAPYPTCYGSTCVPEPTCFAQYPTCEGYATCSGPTCGYSSTCTGFPTCIAATCPPNSTCEGVMTCEGPTCYPIQTCPGVATCEPMTCPIIDSNSVCVYELICATLSEEALEAWYSLHVGDHRELGPCSTTACLPSLTTRTGSLDSTCLWWVLVGCDTSSLPEIGSSMSDCSCDTFPTMPGSPTCAGTQTCTDFYTCGSSPTCPGFGPTMCDGSFTCSNYPTCATEPTCGNFATCWPITCDNSETCEGFPTCEYTTCPNSVTCEGMSTCMGSTCPPTATCPPVTTCEGATCPGVTTCESATCPPNATCPGIETCAQVTCAQLQTCPGAVTCATETCPPNATCEGVETCATATCWGEVTCAGTITCHPYTCDGALTCHTYPSCFGNTCQNPTCTSTQTCSHPSCSQVSTCTGPTCEDYTCGPFDTCEGFETCSITTCDSSPTCDGATCAPSETCPPTATCEGYSSCSGPTCPPTATCPAETCDEVSPIITIGVHQNPVFPSYIQIYVAMDEPIYDDPILTLDNDTLLLRLISGPESEEPVYQAEYELSGAGVLAMSVHVTDRALNISDTTESFVCYPTNSPNGELRSLDGRFLLGIPADAATASQYLLLFERSDPDGHIYDVRPTTLGLAGEARIRFAFHGLDDSGTPAGEYAIFRQDYPDSWTQLPTYLDSETEDLIAYTDRLGEFQIRATGYTASAPLPRTVSLAQNYPNPFNAGTVIAFTLDEPRDVTVEVFNILGKRLAVLLNERRSIGIHEVAWDGTLDNSQRAPSGLYFYRLSAGDETETRKMLLIK